MQIGEFDLVQKANLVVDRQLFLEEVNLVFKLSTSKVSLHANKDMEAVKKLASLERTKDQS